MIENARRRGRGAIAVAALVFVSACGSSTPASDLAAVGGGDPAPASAPTTPPIAAVEPDATTTAPTTTAEPALEEPAPEEPAPEEPAPEEPAREATAVPLDEESAPQATVPAAPDPTATAVPPTPTPTSEPTPTPVPAPTPVPVTVPEFTDTFATIGGGQIDLGSLQGRDVVLWFWAPW